MVPFRGRLYFKQFHKDKSMKWGIEVWMLADLKTGYNVSFDVYTGKVPVNMDNVGLSEYGVWIQIKI